MKIFLKHIIRNIKENVGRTFLIIISLFGVGVLLSLTFGIVFAAQEYWNSLSRSFASDYDYLLYSKTEEELSNERIKETGIPFEMLGISSYNYGYIVDAKEEFASTPLLGLDIEEAINFKVVEIQNEKDITLNNGEVIVSKSVANKYKLKKNGKIKYYDEDGNHHNLNIKYIANDSGLFLQNVSLITNEQTFLKINNEKSMLYEIFYLDYSGNKKVSSLTKELNNIEDDYGLDFVSEEQPSAYEIFGNYLKIGIVFITIVLIVVFFTINSIVKIIINERIPVIGTFRSLGTSIGKMNFILLLEMAVYGLIGGILGSIAGIGFTKILFSIMEMTSSVINVSIDLSSGHGYSFLIAMLTIISLILFQIGLSISEILRSNKLSIKECIFNKHESIYKYSISKILFGLCFLTIGIITLSLNNNLNFIFSIIGILALFVSIAFLLPCITKYFIKLFKRNKNPVLQMSRNTITNNKLQINTNVIVAVMMCVSLVAFSLLNYLIISYKDKIDMVNSDIYVHSTSEPINVTNDIRALDNVETVSVLYTDDLAAYYDSITFANNEVDRLKLIYSDDYKSLSEDSNLLKLDAELANSLSNNEVILSEYFKEKYNLKVGDIVVVNGITKEERFSVETPLNLKIVGFADTSKVDYMSIILSEKIIEDIISFFEEEQYFIKVSNEKHVKTVKKDISKNLTQPLPEVYTQNEYIESIQSAIKETYAMLAGVILIIIGVSLIGIINNQSVSFLERKKEMAILYSTSMSKKQLNKMIFTELILSYFISSLVSIIFTIMLIKLLKYTMEILGLYIPITFSITSVVVLLIIIGIIMTVIYIVIKRKIKKMNIVEELKYE